MNHFLLGIQVFLTTHITILTFVQFLGYDYLKYAPLAQLVEHLTLNQGVQGSSP